MPHLLYFVWTERILNYVVIGLLGLIGLRLLLYYYSFFRHWPRYRKREIVTTEDLKQLRQLPFIKFQITTRGSLGSTEVILRSISYIMQLIHEDQSFYSRFLSIEIITESQQQKWFFERKFALSPIPVHALLLPPLYQSARGTQLKARALHYMVEQRRRGFNRKSGPTFIVHYDEESVMEPLELRRLLHFLAHTDKKLTEGPIYYPLDYFNANIFCRAMEANRPIGCFECRAVMEKGVPFHLHGSNLVVDEELENALGWDIGTLDGQPFIAEDYIFGATAYLRYGPGIFGWHGCVMLEQPPFSIKSAFRQRYRWITGVLQGLKMIQHSPTFQSLPWHFKRHLIYGTRYRILTFAASLLAGIISLFYAAIHALAFFTENSGFSAPFPIMLCLILIGFLWLNSFFIGAWYNLTSIHKLLVSQRMLEMASILCAAPLASMLESAAAFWAVAQWARGNRTIRWVPTPKTVAADKIALKEQG